MTPGGGGNMTPGAAASDLNWGQAKQQAASIASDKPAQPPEMQVALARLGQGLMSLTANIRQVSYIVDRIVGPVPQDSGKENAPPAAHLTAQVDFLIRYIDGLDAELAGAIARISRVI